MTKDENLGYILPVVNTATTFSSTKSFDYHDVPFLVKDYTAQYKSLIHFNKNKSTLIHQWYPFLEGYSSEFIKGIIQEINYTPQCALDPFAGSGTTAVELQNLGINCLSFEVNPFLHSLAVVKMRTDYSAAVLQKHIDALKKKISSTVTQIRLIQPPPIAKTFYKRSGNGKWIFNNAALDGILQLKHAISDVKDLRYNQLFKIVLASILLEVSNVFRNGKALSYRDKWGAERKIRRTDVHEKFFEKLELIFKPDIQILEGKAKTNNGFSNAARCYLGDVRKEIIQIPANSVDLVITSPPYLNSRDYTDSYIVELWILDYVKNYQELRQLRNRTLHSHVQIRIGETSYPKLSRLQTILTSLNQNSDQFWNKELLNMVKGYFADMDSLFTQIALKMKTGGKVYLNVANSAYYGIEIPVDELIGEIAETKGLRVIEIREAIRIRPSSQQNRIIGSLRESVVLLER